MNAREQATRLLNGACDGGDESAAAALLPLVYDELRRVASSLIARERSGHTLEPTALVHEAWMRLINQEAVAADDERAHRRFLGLGARAMRQVLVDHARSKGREKRGGDLDRITLPIDLPVSGADPAALLDLESALERLQQRSERLAQLAELRLFGGLSVLEAAAVLEVSPATAKTDWALARGLLTGMLRERERTRSD